MTKNILEIIPGKVHLAFFFCLMILPFPVYTLAQQADYTPLPIFDFMDSAHHWRDINEEDRTIQPEKNQLVYSRNEITKIADNILLYQKCNGGWVKNYDMLAILTDEQKTKLLQAKDELNTSFDNGTTHAQVEYLAHVYSVTKENKYKEACIRGIEFILSAQYANGGFPQFYPDTSGYRKYITFNDGAMMGIMKVLSGIANKKEHYSFVDDDLRRRAAGAYQEGIECILKCQIIDNGKVTVWCQQHDNVNHKPQDARTFELASICNGESAEIVLFLMEIDNPSEEIINSIQHAVKWFGDSKIYGVRVETIDAPAADYQYHSTNVDRIVVKDSSAPAIWTRYIELGTHRPMFCNRDGKPVYSLAEVERERRTGYAWYVDSPQLVLNKYPEWQNKWAPEKNVLKSLSDSK